MGSPLIFNIKCIHFIQGTMPLGFKKQNENLAVKFKTDSKSLLPWAL